MKNSDNALMFKLYITWNLLKYIWLFETEIELLLNLSKLISVVVPFHFPILGQEGGFILTGTAEEIFRLVITTHFFQTSSANVNS